MRLNKKIIALLGTVILAANITACSSNNNSSNADGKQGTKLLSKGKNNVNKEANSKEDENSENEKSNSNNNSNDVGNINNSEQNNNEDNGVDNNNSNTNQQSNDSSNSNDTDNDKKYVYINASSLRVREEPTVKAPVIVEALRGTRVKLVDEKIDENNDKWFYITIENKVNTSGWVSSEYTVEKLSDVTGFSFTDVDLSPQDKVDEYEDNPRVKVKGVYVSIYSAASNIDKFIDMAKRSGINAFVIDVKADGGEILFHSEAAEKYNPNANKTTFIKDMDAFMKKLKDNNIYTIARVVSFKDPIYTKTHPDRAIVYRSTGKPFSNNDGLTWATAYDKNLWEYNVAVAKEAAKFGFNEIQFDYVRFPASNGGKMDKQLDYRNTEGVSKAKGIQEYLQYAYEELKSEHVYIAADVYGLVGSVNDDMGLGQYWEAISNVTDYICPMMYPSHYGEGVYGLSVPDAYPYETINKGAMDANNRNYQLQTPSTIRPWIQDFTAGWVKGHIKYGEAQVRAQIKALEENGIDEFLLWNASNIYTESAVD